MKKIIIWLIAFGLAGCASTVIDSQSFKSYQVGQVKTASIGEAFLTDQKGSITSVRHWVGVLNSADGWQVTKVPSEDFIRKDLIYSGKSASTIKVSYREFRGGLAAPAFSQALEYDLNESKTIKFQRFTLDVINATNQSITYKILSD